MWDVLNICMFKSISQWLQDVKKSKHKSGCSICSRGWGCETKPHTCCYRQYVHLEPTIMCQTCEKQLISYFLHFTPEAAQAHWTISTPQELWQRYQEKKTANCDSHNLCFRKDNVAKWKDGPDDITGKRNKVSWRKASRMTEHTHSHTLSPPTQTSIFSWSTAFESQTFTACRPFYGLNERKGEFASHTCAQWHWLVAGLEQ